MNKLLFLFALWCLAACSNNASTTPGRTDSLQRSSGLPTDSLEREAEFSFLDGCIDNSKLTLGDQRAFVFCKCIYEQLRAKNPGMDSTAIDALMRDTAQVARMAANCR